jgi:hypothetical protein
LRKFNQYVVETLTNPNIHLNEYIKAILYTKWVIDWSLKDGFPRPTAKKQHKSIKRLSQ